MTRSVVADTSPAGRPRSGISARHGGHHVAQKLTMTTLPRSEAADSSRPSRSLTVNAGARGRVAEETQRQAFAAGRAAVASALGGGGRVEPAVELPGVAGRGPRQQDARR